MIKKLKNKEKIKLKRNIKKICVCGGKYTVANKSVHVKNKKHQKYLQTLDQ